MRRKDAITMLTCRSVLEDCERCGWVKACIRKPRLVLYPREEIMAAVYRLHQGEYPA